MQPLDRSNKSNAVHDRAPSTQMLRYLSRVDVQSEGKMQWGILTNGKLWRLYYTKAKSRSEDYCEIDLADLVEFPSISNGLFTPDTNHHQYILKLFYVLFSPNSFLPTAEEGLSFHEYSLNEGRKWESRVTEKLSETVFQHIYPTLILSIIKYDPQKPTTLTQNYLDEVQHAALILLYRLLFVLYAEDRELLPIHDPKYQDYGLQKKIRQDIQQKIDQGSIFSAHRHGYYHNLQELFRSIDKGDPSLNLPPYNGGLFSEETAPLLKRLQIPDAEIAPLIDQLSREYDTSDKKPLWINYRDLSVQQLGSIYEKLLEFKPHLDETGEIKISPNIFARKTSGSYYTPENLVKLIIEKTLSPLIQERHHNFENKIAELAQERTKKDLRLEKLYSLKLDPANNILNLKICDPAMGSGHFLVSLVDYLADQTLEAIARTEATGAVPWLDENQYYQSLVSQRISEIRKRIMEQAKTGGWQVQEHQLEDRQIIRRIILKRCVFGVDKNPMAVELAKLSLWLHTFTVGAPLSFLDHHLRCGDSLFGEWVGEFLQEINRAGELFTNNPVTKARQSAEAMTKIETITDADIAEVKESALYFATIQEATTELQNLLSFFHARRWFVAQNNHNKSQVTKIKTDLQKLLDGYPEELGKKQPKINRKHLADLLTNMRQFIAQEAFLHWQVAFPNIWKNWENPWLQGGFDAVIGNPPWDRMKLQEVEWFAERKIEIAKQTKASDRKKMIQHLAKQKNPLWHDYQTASQTAETAMIIARTNGQYPLLSGGDTNLYSLFVERAHHLIHPQGMVGLLVPSGIAADKTAAEFFRSITTTSRLAALYDFENKKNFFPDVTSQFKFCVYIAGGTKRTFEDIECAFFLQDLESLRKSDRLFQLKARDFIILNPNTGTTPFFRSWRDAEITRKFYQQFPVLADHRPNPPAQVWPIKYFTMFHMTNDSNLFKTAGELEKMGCYPIEKNRWKKADDVYLPLYVGKMIHHYNHRTASVEVNEENLQVVTSSDTTTMKDLSNPFYYPKPQYWVLEKERDLRLRSESSWLLAFRDIARSTDSRTIISSIIPKTAVGNTLPLIIPEISPPPNTINMVLIYGNLNSFSLDYIARQKVQGTHLNWYILEQLPFIPLEKFQTKFGKKIAADIIKEDVLYLTYTAYDLQGFAHDMGYHGQPFAWDEAERLRRRCRLDALYSLLYDVNDEDMIYILDSFPIIKKDDEQKYGKFLTRDLIMAYRRALQAGDPEANITLPY
jgi:hypothetical protein